MRLIDVDDLIEKLEEFKQKKRNKCFTFENVKEMLEKAPTAYAVEKVVEQLRDRAFERYGNVGMGGQMVVDFDDVVAIINKDWSKENERTTEKGTDL